MPENKTYQQKLASMIKGIAKRASTKLFSRDIEDIEQDLWVKVLETEKRKGHQLDLNLAAKVCYDYIKDMIDYDMRRNHIAAGDSIENIKDDKDTADQRFIGVKQDKGDYASYINLKDLYKQFPEGSKERIFLDFWGNRSGAMPNTNVIPDKSREYDGYTEGALAKMLGFASASSSGYRNFRNKMKKIISDYLNANV